jgi:hypothetical protein
MRADLFQDDKGIHIKLKKDVHALFRSEMFKTGISMQEAFNEFARQVVEGTRSAKFIVQAASSKKMKASLEKRTRKWERPVGDLDVETLYDLINTKISEGSQ